MITNIMELRQWNKEKIVAALQRLGPCTKADIAKETGLSMATCSGIFNELNEEKEIIKVDHTGSGIGRPSDIFIFNNDYLHMLGLSIYKTKSGIGVGLAVSDAVGNIINSQNMSYAAIDTDKIQEIVRDQLSEDSLIKVVGISLPGVIGNGLVDSCEIHELEGVDFKKLLQDSFDVDVQVWNDMNALTYYLYRKQQKDIVNFAAIFFPENMEESCVGSGFVVDGHLLHGCNMVSGELSLIGNAFGITDEMQRSFISDKSALHKFAAQMLITVCCTIDPSHVVIISNTLSEDDASMIQKYFKECISLRHFPQIYFRKEDNDDYVKAIVRRTIDCVFFKYSL